MAARSITSAGVASATTLSILLAASAGHLINDTLQSVLLSIYPLIKDPLGLSFAQIGLITLVFQLTASILQPFVGAWTDRKPMPFSLVFGMGASSFGIFLLAEASGFLAVLLAAAAIGIGSSIFHPEASRVARLASGGRYGFAQSLFQVGGNSGQALGPLLVALIVVPNGQPHAAWFLGLGLLGMVLLYRVGRWYAAHLEEQRRRPAAVVRPASPVGRRAIAVALFVLIALTFSKNIYTAFFQSYYAFYLMHRFGLGVGIAQIHLFLFLAATAAGTFFGGPLGDRIGRKPVLWLSIAGVLPFTLAMPFLGLFWTALLAVLVGFLMASAFPAIVVYAQELLPGRVGMIAGLFFGFAFGMGGIAAAVLGWLADLSSIEAVFAGVALTPAIGLLVWFLPDLDRAERAAA
ncbi:MAG: MFS transporter [Geminicoccaceae bacterium]|nr:MFS transporter [Geminicoccaceae bacterium]MDW8368980.1 MFS transporter [Geminicoccaceae bacterium]